MITGTIQAHQSVREQLSEASAEQAPGFVNLSSSYIGGCKCPGRGKAVGKAARSNRWWRWAQTRRSRSSMSAHVCPWLFQPFGGAEYPVVSSPPFPARLPFLPYITTTEYLPTYFQCTDTCRMLPCSHRYRPSFHIPTLVFDRRQESTNKPNEASAWWKHLQMRTEYFVVDYVHSPSCVVCRVFLLRVRWAKGFRDGDQRSGSVENDRVSDQFNVNFALVVCRTLIRRWRSGRFCCSVSMMV